MKSEEIIKRIEGVRTYLTGGRDQIIANREDGEDSDYAEDAYCSVVEEADADLEKLINEIKEKK